MAEAKILIIDDDPDLAEYLKTRLEMEGYIADTAGDGRSGMKKAGLKLIGL